MQCHPLNKLVQDKRPWSNRKGKGDGKGVREPLVSFEPSPKGEEWINRKQSGNLSVSPLPATLLVLLYYFIKSKSCKCHSTPSLVQFCHSTLSRLNYNLITQL